MSRRVKYSLITLSSVLAIAIVVYLAIGFSYKEKFVPGTVIGNLNISGKTVAEASEEMNNRYKDSVYVIKEDGKEIAKITGKELEMKPDFEDYLTKLNDSQNKFSWLLTKYNHSQEQSNPEGANINPEKYKERFEAIKFDEENRKEPENAKVVFKDDKFIVESEKVGNTLDMKKVEKTIKDGIESGITEIDIKSCYVQPKVKKDDKSLQKASEEMNKMIDKEIVYRIAGNDAIIPKESMATWLTYDKEGNVKVNDDELYAYVLLLNEQYANRGEPKKFNSTLGGEIEVKGGIYGWSIDGDEEFKGLKEDFLKSDKKIERIPVTKGVGFDPEKGSTDTISGDYIELDLTNQHMWLYKNDELVLDTPVVTGNPNTGHATPAGVFYVWSKETNRILRGADYATPVSYWMPIDWTGVGIHDSNWQPSYGGGAYLYRGSHGCINTPPYMASQFFNSIEVGIPVVSHY